MSHRSMAPEVPVTDGAGVSVMAAHENFGTKEYRLASRRAVALIADITSRLELLRDVREAAVCLWHQYFATRSFEHSDPFPLVCASVSLACKSLDQPRSVQVSTDVFEVALPAGVSRVISAAVTGHHLFQLLL